MCQYVSTSRHAAQWRNEGGGGLGGSLTPGDTIEPLRLSRARLTPWNNQNFTTARKKNK